MEWYQVVFGSESFQFTKLNPGLTQVQRAHSWGQFYEVEMLRDIASRLEPGSIVFDVGANVGNHVVFLAAICGAAVMAIEPDPSTHLVLEHNLSLNRLGQVKTYCHLAGAEPGWARIVGGTEGNRQFGMSRPPTSTDTRLFPVVPLDAIKVTGPVRLLKIDTEGFELQVLEGAVGILERDHPTIYAEAATLEERNRLDQFLERFGYQRSARFNSTPTYRWSV